MLSLILGMLFMGLVVGALGRLLVPGPNPMGLFSTILVGLAGSVLGGVVGRILFGVRFYYAVGLSLVVSVLCTALLVYLIQRRRSL